VESRKKGRGRERGVGEGALEGWIGQWSKHVVLKETYRGRKIITVLYFLNKSRKFALNYICCGHFAYLLSNRNLLT